MSPDGRKKTQHRQEQLWVKQNPRLASEHPQSWRWLQAHAVREGSEKRRDTEIKPAHDRPEEKGVMGVMTKGEARAKICENTINNFMPINYRM